LNSFLIRAASELPSDIFDLTPEGRKTFLARRLCGVDPINWFPQSPRAIQSIPLPAVVPFTVVMLGKAQDAREYSAWANSSEVPPTIVAESGADLTYSDMTVEGLQRRFLEVCEAIPNVVDLDAVQQAKFAIESWAPRASRSLGYTVGGHASVTPNLMVLTAHGYCKLVHGRFDKLNNGNKPYVEQITKTTWSVLQERDKIDTTETDGIFRRSPALNIFAPAMVPASASLCPPDNSNRAEKKRFATALRILERQTGYNFQVRTDHQFESIAGLNREKLAAKAPRLDPHPLIRVRQIELSLATEAVGALAASDLSATLRLPNDVNRTAGAVRQFASHYRSDNRSSRKRLIAFRQVQNRLANAVPAELLDVVGQTKDDIRIVADAHLEWIDVGGLPLGIRRNVSRIPVTPGNLFVEQVAAKPLFRIMASDFRNILVVSALKRNDPIRRMFETAFSGFEKEWKDTLQVQFAEASSKDELIAALSAFNGPLVMFDGHGSHSPGQPALLHLHDEPCDVWQLHGKVKPPPIVVLSACDTHAADRNHETTANGFLALGSRAVLGSVFPLEAMSAAIFAARLLYRIAGFIPAAVGLLGRPLTWTEVVSGMLRMQLLTDFLRHLERKKIVDHVTYIDVHQKGNMAINGNAEDPFGEVLEMLVERGLKSASLQRELELTVANSSVISYLNIGRPETILVDVEGRLARENSTP